MDAHSGACGTLRAGALRPGGGPGAGPRRPDAPFDRAIRARASVRAYAVRVAGQAVARRPRCVAAVTEQTAQTGSRVRERARRRPSWWDSPPRDSAYG